MRFREANTPGKARVEYLCVWSIKLTYIFGLIIINLRDNFARARRAEMPPKGTQSHFLSKYLSSLVSYLYAHEYHCLYLKQPQDIS